MIWMLGKIDFSDPTIWGVLIGWVLSVTLHEFAHGIVAYWGGDYTIRDRGGLSLNPIQYIDPVMSLLLPVIFLLMGGIPLPGGSTYVRRDLLRSKGWEVAVSAAGPAMNMLLFGLLCIPLLPSVGWVDPASAATWTTAQKFVAAMCYLQLLSVILNLIPVPPLDGFGMIAPFLPPDLRLKLSTPPLSTMFFIGYFMLLSTGFFAIIDNAMYHIMGNQIYFPALRGYFAVFHPEVNL